MPFIYYLLLKFNGKNAMSILFILTKLLLLKKSGSPVPKSPIKCDYIQLPRLISNPIIIS